MHAFNAIDPERYFPGGRKPIRLVPDMRPRLLSQERLSELLDKVESLGQSVTNAEAADLLAHIRAMADLLPQGYRTTNS